MKTYKEIIPWLLLSLLAGYSVAQDKQTTSSEIVWHRTVHEHAERIIIFETTVDGQLVATAKFPVSRAARGEIKPEQKQEIFSYNFILSRKRGRSFNDVSSGRVEGNIWEAGGEKDGIIFGISWVTDNRVILNTLHYALLDKVEAVEIAPNVYFKSYWLPKQD
jgi:hypothetical protein